MREIRSSGSVGGGHPAQLNVRQVPPIPILLVFEKPFSKGPLRDAQRSFEYFIAFP
jgi:hypothetical protein